VRGHAGMISRAAPMPFRSACRNPARRTSGQFSVAGDRLLAVRGFADHLDPSVGEEP